MEEIAFNRFTVNDVTGGSDMIRPRETYMVANVYEIRRFLFRGSQLLVPSTESLLCYPGVNELKINVKN